MNIQFSLGKNIPYTAIEISDEITAEELAERYREETPWPVVAAIINHEVKPLITPIHENDTVQLLDIRNKQAYLIFQNSLILLFICSVRQILGNVHVEVMTSLNDGLFLQVMRHGEDGEFQVVDMSEDDVARTYFYMKKMVQEDHPIEAKMFRRKEAMEILKETGLTEKYRSLQRVKVDETVRIYTLAGYSDFFYNYMVPSTGYVSKFELMKYREGLLLRHPSAQNPGVIPDYVDEYRVYNALKEQRQWNHLLGVQYQADINDRIESGAYRTLIKLSEALHDKKIVEIADRISKEEKKVVLILGPSSSGKTTFAHRLIIQLMVNGMKPLYIGTDDYFVEREDTPLDADGQKNYENIDALDLSLFNRQMKDLLEGREVDMPVFNFKTGHKEFGKRKTRLARNGVIVIEGIHAFNHLLTRQLPEESKFRIYISPLTQINLDSHNRIPTTDTRVIRRIVRDNRNRAHTAAMTLHLWPKVREGENKNIFPLSNEADVFFNTVHVYEMTVLKKYAVPLLKEVRQEEEEYAEAQRLLRLFRYVDSLDDESIIAGDSILREFIGGSVYTD